MHIRATNFFGGPERQILGHIVASTMARHRVLTFIERGAVNPFFENCLAKGISVEAIPTQNPFAPSVIKALRNAFKKARPDIICSHGYKPTLLTLLAKAGLGIPLIIFARGRTGENRMIRLFEFLERQAMRISSVIVPVSEGQAHELMRCGLPKGNMRVVLNAIDADRMKTAVGNAEQKRKEMGFAPDDMLIATSGRLSPEKAQKDLITAFSMISDRYTQARLLIVGDGPLKKELELLSSGKKLSRVHFLGFRRDMDEIMAITDLFVLPSLTEGLPNVILEAFACAKPVVATTVGGVPEVVTDRENGLLVQPGQPELLAEAISECLDSPQIAKKMGLSGFRKVQEEFTFASQARRLEDIYFEVLEHPAVDRAEFERVSCAMKYNAK